MADGPVSYTLEGSTAVVRMDDGKANALGEAMIEALLAALDRAESEATAIVLAGRPERFSAGFDLRIMTQGPEAARALLRKGSALLLRLYVAARITRSHGRSRPDGTKGGYRRYQRPRAVEKRKLVSAAGPRICRGEEPIHTSFPSSGA